MSGRHVKQGLNDNQANKKSGSLEILPDRFVHNPFEAEERRTPCTSRPGGTAESNQISTSTATRGRASAKAEIKNGACEMRHGTCRRSMARLSRLQLPVFSVSEWSVDQHSPADPEAAASKQQATREGKQNGWGGGERKGLEGGEAVVAMMVVVVVVVGLALGRSQQSRNYPCWLAV